MSRINALANHLHNVADILDAVATQMMVTRPDDYDLDAVHLISMEAISMYAASADLFGKVW